MTIANEIVKALTTTQCCDCKTESCGGAGSVKDCPHYTPPFEKKHYKKAKIVSAFDKDAWYINKIGDIILVKDVDWPSAYVEHKSGASVLRRDLKYIAK